MTGTDRRLVLCTEELFSGIEVTERVRQAVGGRVSLSDAVDELGLDLRKLAETPSVVLLRPRRLGVAATHRGSGRRTCASTTR